MNIFLTGGSGYIGSHLLPLLIKEGHHVYALSRSFNSAYKIEQMGAEPVMGDLNGACTLVDTLEKMDAVIHAAGYMDFTYYKSKYYAINYSGTQILLKAAISAKIKHFIYISAASVVNGECAEYIDESYQPKESPGDYYSRSKLLAEKLILKANSESMRTLCIRPPFVWGETNPHLSRILQGKNNIHWKWIGNGDHHLSTIHVQNLNMAILAALNSEHGGKAYFVTDGNEMPFKDFFTVLLNAENIFPPDEHISRHAAMFLAKRIEWFYKKFRKKLRPPLSPGMINMMGTHFTLNDSLAREELGFENAITLAEGLQTLKDQIKQKSKNENVVKVVEDESSQSKESVEPEESESKKEDDSITSVDDECTQEEDAANKAQDKNMTEQESDDSTKKTLETDSTEHTESVNLDIDDNTTNREPQKDESTAPQNENIAETVSQNSIDELDESIQTKPDESAKLEHVEPSEETFIQKNDPKKENYEDYNADESSDQDDSPEKH